MNWLSFVCADLHKSVGALFSVGGISEDKAVQAAVKKFLVARAEENLRYVDSKLEGKDYLMGKAFTAADAYAFVVLGWTKWLEIPLTSYKNIQEYMDRVASRPAVAKVLKEEGLV
jgi:glutathione S-transferase